ncbi:MAG: hypothetical protein AAF235_06985, partial [Planctomycetota bacterium]
MQAGFGARVVAEPADQPSGGVADLELEVAGGVLEVVEDLRGRGRVLADELRAVELPLRDLPTPPHEVVWSVEPPLHREGL